MRLMPGHRRCRIIQHAENHICVVVHRIYDTRHTRCEKCRIAHESEACAFPINPVEALRHRDSGTHAETSVNHIKRHRISKCITSDIATEIRFLSLHRLLHCIKRSAVRTTCAKYRRTHRKRRYICPIKAVCHLLCTEEITQNICNQIRTVLATCRHLSI